MEINSNSSEETVKLGEKIGKKVRSGAIIALFGDLGAGKTTLVQGIAKGLGISDYITSPTFILISEFIGRLVLYHIDLYRLDTIEQINEIGIEEYFSKENSICVIEWAEKLGGSLPENSVKINIKSVSESERKSIIEGLEIK